MRLNGWMGALLAALLVGPMSSVTAQTARSAPRMAAEDYATLRSLAEYVDDGAQFALEQARGLVGTGAGRTTQERALMQSLRDFAQKARTFHNRVDEYEFRPWSMDQDLASLRTAARTVNGRLRQVPALRDTFEDWDLVRADLDNIQRLIRGTDVDLRRPDPEWDSAGGTHHDPSWPTYGTGDFASARLEEFRGLARDLDASTQRAVAAAQRQRADYSENGAQHLADLEHFATQTRDTRARVERDMVRPRDIGPLVTHLLEDARRVDQSMRRARVFTGVWEEWSLSVDALNKMTALTR